MTLQTDKNAKAKIFSELIMSLKLVEEHQYLHEICEWVNPTELWHAVWAADLNSHQATPAVIQAMQEYGVQIGVASGYQGVLIPEGDEVTARVSRRSRVLLPNAVPARATA